MIREACVQDPLLIGVLVAANLVIALAYMAIPGVILWVLMRAPRVPYTAVWWLFAAFIIGCGGTHFVAALVFFRAAYHLEAAVCSFTAIISTTTAVLLYLWRHRILASLRGAVRLEDKVVRAS